MSWFFDALIGRTASFGLPYKLVVVRPAMLSRNACKTRRFLHAQTCSYSPPVFAITTNPSSNHFPSDVSQASSTFRHLLRALLREATYLPDPAARTYYRLHIIERFRSYGSIFVRADAKTTQQHDFSQVEKQKRLLALGRKQLRALARANLGHLEPLMKVLNNTYGRCGRRRARLLLPWLPPDLATGTPAGAPHVSDTQGVQGLLKRMKGQTAPSAVTTGNNAGQSSDANQTGTRVGDIAEFGTCMPECEKAPSKAPTDETEAASRRPPKAVIPKLPEPLQALMRAQATSGLGPSLSNLSMVPVIPETNIWRRPTPMCRQRAIIRRWKADVRKKLLPPLPPQEHKRLVILAAGSRSIDSWNINQLSQPRRRAAGLSSDRTNFADVLPDPNDEDDCRDSLLGDMADIELMQTDKTHRITPRFMSRCLQRIVAMTPTLQNSSGEWRAHFGSSEKEWSTLWRVKNSQSIQKGRDEGSQPQNIQSERQSGVHDTTSQDEPEVTDVKSWMFDLQGEELKPPRPTRPRHWGRIERQIHKEVTKIQKVKLT